MLLVFFFFVLYIAVLMGVLWLGTRVVRHAWYWHSSPDTSSSTPERPVPGASDR